MSGGIDHKTSVLFVCLGNICRSPMAEGAFRAAAQQVGLDTIVDSAGTASYHLGDRPDSRAIAICRAYRVEIGSQSARQIELRDFYRFDHIIAMDSANLEAIKTRAPRDGTAQVSLLLDGTPEREGQSVPDPYHGTAEDFEQAWNLIAEGVIALVQSLQAEAATARS
jgi:protein-tyrosine phosphatase